MNVKKLVNQKVLAAAGLAVGIGATVAAVVVTRNAAPVKVAAPIITKLAVRAGVMHTVQAGIGATSGYITHKVFFKTSHVEALQYAWNIGKESLTNPSNIVFSLGFGVLGIHKALGNTAIWTSVSMSVGSTALQLWEYFGPSKGVKPDLTLHQDPSPDEVRGVPVNLFRLEDGPFSEAAFNFAASLNRNTSNDDAWNKAVELVGGFPDWNEGESELFAQMVVESLKQLKKRSA